MSIQWTIIATFLYFEIAAVLLLLIPFISPSKWQKVFRSRFLLSLGNQVTIYFYILIGVLVLFFLDAIREMSKYGDIGTNTDHQHQHLDAEIQNHMKLFRAQRNFFISGFSLFLSLVIRRLANLISNQAQLMATNEAALKQASSATETAKKLMNQKKTGETGENERNEIVVELETKLAETKEAQRKAENEASAIKSQAESVSKEYDRLLEEYSKLERKCQKLENSSGDKKNE